MKNVSLEEKQPETNKIISNKNCIICGSAIDKRIVITRNCSYCSKCNTQKKMESEKRRKANTIKVFEDDNLDIWMGFQGERNLPQSLRVRKEEVFETENENHD